MKWVFERIYESFRIIIMVAVAQSWGLLEWIVQNPVWALVILTILEYIVLRCNDAEGEHHEY